MTGLPERLIWPEFCTGLPMPPAMSVAFHGVDVDPPPVIPIESVA